MGKSVAKELDVMQAKLEVAYTTIKRAEAEISKLRQRLHAKAQEVTLAKQGRKEALTLLKLAASDPEVRERAIALLAADTMGEKITAELAAEAASQTSIPGTEAQA